MLKKLVGFFTSGFGHIVLLGFLFSSIIASVYLVRIGTKDFTPRANTQNKTNSVIFNLTENNPNTIVPPYSPNTIAVKMKHPLALRKLSDNTAINLDMSTVPMSQINPDTLPESFRLLNAHSTIKKIDKVFKGIQDPITELAKIKQKYSTDIVSGKRKLDEQKFLLTDLSRTYLVTLDSNDAKKSIFSLTNSSDVESVGLNYIGQTSFIPNDPLFTQQWSHTNAKAPQGWDITRGNGNITIAVVDTGVKFDHPDLAVNMRGNCTYGCPAGTGYDFVDIDAAAYQANGFILVNGEDYTIPDTNPSDYNGHGTHVSGIAAGVGNNDLGISGVCMNCKIMPVRAGFSIIYNGNEGGSLEWDDVAQAITYAADNGANIISMSFGGSEDSILLKPALDYAYARGVMLIAAAGNSNTDSFLYSYPAAYENVLAVTALDTNDGRASFSNYGYWTDVAAPGVDILSTVPNIGTISDPSGYKSISGTSMATPYVSGLAGLILSKNTTWSPQQVKQIILSGADTPLENSHYFGIGKINNFSSLQLNTLSSAVAKIDTPLNDDFISSQNNSINGSTGGSFTLQYGSGIYPTTWTTISTGGQLSNGRLGTLNLSNINDGTYTMRLTVNISAGITTDRKTTFISREFKTGWPKILNTYDTDHQPVITDLDGDGKKEIVLSGYDELNGGGKINIYTTSGELVKSIHIDAESRFSPSVGDIDGDGKKEIVVTSMGHYGQNDNHIYAFRSDGTMIWEKTLEVGIFHLCTVLSDVNNDGQLDIITRTYDSKLYVLDNQGNSLPGWPVDFPEYDIYSLDCPVAADLDHDGYNEVIATRSIDAGYNPGDIWRRYKGSLTVFNYNGSQRWMKEFPTQPQTTKYYSRGIYSSPVVGDINNDGYLDIVTSQYEFNANDFNDRVYKNSYYVYDRIGSILPGWPVSVDSLGETLEPPTLINLNTDPYLEIIGHGKNSLYAFNHDGSFAFPSLKINPDNLDESNINTSIVGDMTGDGNPDILVYAYKNCRSYGCSFDPKLFIVTHEGKIYTNNWPKGIASRVVVSTPSIDDIDNDGKIDVVFQSDKHIYVWSAEQIFSSATLLWPMYQHDEKHSGVYSSSFLLPSPTSIQQSTPTPPIGIINGNFEGGAGAGIPNGWKGRNLITSTDKLITSDSHSPAHSFRMNGLSPSGKTKMLEQIVTNTIIPKKSSFTIKGWNKLTNIISSGKIELHVLITYNDSTSTRKAYKLSFPAKKQWNRQIGSITLEKDAKQIKVLLKYSGKGSAALFDDITLEKGKSSADIPPSSPDPGD